MSSSQDNFMASKSAYRSFQEDLQLLCARHPIAHLVMMYSTLFTFNTGWNVLFVHLNESPTYGGRVLQVALFTAVMTTVFFCWQRPRLKRLLSSSAK